jgi:hypothetical protein
VKSVNWLVAAVMTGLMVGTSVEMVSSEDNGTARIGSGNGGANNFMAIDLEGIEAPEPGLGAWTLYVGYDPSVVSVSGCAAFQDGVCDLQPEDNRILVTGASANGLEGNFPLATLVFQCSGEAGSTDLDLFVEIWAYATAGFDKSPPEGVDGSITCREPFVPSVTRKPTATPAPVLPPAGSASAADRTAGWPYALLALAGGATLVAAGAALRRRA